MQALTLTREAIEKTLEYVHYQLVAYLQGVIFPRFARDCGFPALAVYLEKYEGHGLDQKSAKQALHEIYKYHQIYVESPEMVCLVKSRSKNTVYWQIFLPRVNEDDRIAILGNCPPFMVIDGYTWDVFVLPQVIGNALMEISFGEGKRIEELPYKIGLTMRDYEYIGFP